MRLQGLGRRWAGHIHMLGISTCWAHSPACLLWPPVHPVLRAAHGGGGRAHASVAGSTGRAQSMLPLRAPPLPTFR